MFRVLDASGEELKVLIEGTCCVVPPNLVIGMFSPDGQTQACWGIWLGDR